MCQISIIMPVRNESKYIEECIDSILNQSFKDWELVVCDDHSIDDTLEKLLSYAKNDQRIKVYSNIGSGIIPALQTAYAESKGRFITRMDGDDVMPKGKLKTLVTILEKNGPGVVATGKVKYFPEEHIADGFKVYESWLNTMCDKENHWQDIYKECVIPSPCWMMHQSDFETIGGFGPMVYPEDYDLVFRMFQGGMKVVASQEILHLWRDHPERTSRNSDHYQTQTFFGLKLDYLFLLEDLSNRDLVIWGAGKKGKVLANHLLDMGKPFYWVCNNFNKVGKKILNVELDYFEQIRKYNKPLVLVTVSGHSDRTDIINFLENSLLETRGNYYLFC